MGVLWGQLVDMFIEGGARGMGKPKEPNPHSTKADEKRRREQCARCPRPAVGGNSRNGLCGDCADAQAAHEAGY